VGGGGGARLTPGVGLHAGYESLAVRLVDTVLEEVLWGLETNNFRMQQKRLAMVKLLGELYNYRQVDSNVIFETLYLIIEYGYPDPKMWGAFLELDAIDPPHDQFRLRVAATLLDTCGEYFNRGAARKKLDRFLAFFQRYHMTKVQVPLDIEFMMQDLFEKLRPKVVRCKTLAVAHMECMEILRQEQEEADATERAARVAAGIEEEAVAASNEADSDDEDEDEDDDDLEDGESSDSSDGTEDEDEDEELDLEEDEDDLLELEEVTAAPPRFQRSEA
jgi:regulator of nonsense transcripts 2